MRAINLIAVLCLCVSSFGCAKKAVKAEEICHDLEVQKLVEKCRPEGSPLFSVPRFTAQWSFDLANVPAKPDPILGKPLKPAGLILQFESVKDRNEADERLRATNAVLPVLPFVHRLAKPPMLVLFPVHDDGVTTRAILERRYGYDDDSHP